MATQSKRRTRSSTPARSDDPTLIQAARHLILPKGIVNTGWPQVRAICLTVGIVFDLWQEGLGRALLGKRADGLYAADYAVISIPRQVGKTYLLGAIVLALCIANPRMLVLWTAHRSATAQDTFRDLKSLAQLPALRNHVRKVYDSGDRREIVLDNGSRVAFGARERGFGRGFKKVGVLIFDEAQILTDKGLDDMVPTTNRHPNPLIILAGTPPKPTDPGETFRRLRAEALDGEAGVLYVEMSADAGADPRDRQQWAKANPSYPKHTSARAMLRMLKILGVESFLREGFGIWDSDERPLVMPNWPNCSTLTEPPPVSSLGVAVDPDRVWVSVGALCEGEGRRHLGAVLRRRLDVDRAHVVSEVARIQREHGCAVVIDKKGHAASLGPDLEAAGAVISWVGFDEYVTACADVFDEVAAKELEHGGYPDLDAAVRAATKRKIVGRWGWARYDGDISMLDAVTLAFAGADLSPTEPWGAWM